MNSYKNRIVGEITGGILKIIPEGVTEKNPEEITYEISGGISDRIPEEIPEKYWNKFLKETQH